MSTLHLGTYADRLLFRAERTGMSWEDWTRPQGIDPEHITRTGETRELLDTAAMLLREGFGEPMRAAHQKGIFAVITDEKDWSQAEYVLRAGQEWSKL